MYSECGVFRIHRFAHAGEPFRLNRPTAVFNGLGVSGIRILQEYAHFSSQMVFCAMVATEMVVTEMVATEMVATEMMAVAATRVLHTLVGMMVTSAGWRLPCCEGRRR
jgi:hypothetical protein